MWDDFVDGQGPIVSVEELQVPRARTVAAYLTSGDPVGARLIEARRGQNSEALVIELHPEIGQLPAVDLQNVERLLIQFEESDKVWPWVWALREGFPEGLPHTNLMPDNYPVCLCIGEEPFVELRRTLTPAQYIERIRSWFADTARGALHREDQQLEPFLSSHNTSTIILPSEFADVADGVGSGYRVVLADDGHFRVAKDAPSQLSVGLVVMTAPAKIHGFIRHQPATLGGLGQYLDEPGYNFIGSLHEHMLNLRDDLGPAVGNPPSLLILLRVPLKRRANADVERIETKAFYVSNADEVAEALGVWQVHGGQRAILFHGATHPERVPLQPCRVETELTPSEAVVFNGYAARMNGFVAIGGGAIGSHVLMALAKSGSVPSAVIDEDFLSPHNFARHALGGTYVGVSKARALVNEFVQLFPSEAHASAIVDNFVSPKNPAVIAQKLAESRLVLDLSASQAVARELAGNDAAPRAVSAFFNPKGNDLVFLAESADRSVRLNELEMQYYWRVAVDERLEGHLARGDLKRYAYGCRDHSLVIPETNVLILSGIAAEAVQAVSKADEAFAQVWRLRPNLSVDVIACPSTPMMKVSVGGWTCCVSKGVAASMDALRERHLPKETGGVLIGGYDLATRRIYIVGPLEAPEDSEADESGFTRGVDGLAAFVEQISDQVNGQLHYVGEWHSHPPGHSSQPSTTDEVAYTQLAARMRLAGYPETMLVIGENDISCIIDGDKGSIPWQK